MSPLIRNILTVDCHPDGVLDGAAADVGVLRAARHRLQVVARPRAEVHARQGQRLAARRPRKLKGKGFKFAASADATKLGSNVVLGCVNHGLKKDVVFDKQRAAI